MAKLSSVVIILLLFSCRKEPVPVDFGYEYYPLEIGRFQVYDVTAISHDDAVNIHDTSHYQLKEIIESSFTDNSGNQAFRIERYERDSSHHPWQIADVWTVRLIDQRLEKTEENVKYIKLVFPVKESEFWDGNAYNSNQEDEYTYVAVDEPISLNGNSFEETTTVIQRDLVGGPFFHEDVREVYARNVGLISIYSKVLEINLFDTLDVKLGEERFQTLIDYGVE